jgi:hypothetical protein
LLVVVELAGGAAESALVGVAVRVLRVHGFWKTWDAELGATVILVTAGWWRCSLRGICYLSPWQREWRWERRGPHVERSGSVGVPGAVVGVCVEASMNLRDRRPCLCSLRTTVPWWRSSEGRWFPAAGCATTWHSVGDDGAGVGGLLRSPLPCGCSWWCVMLGAFVSVLGFVRQGNQVGHSFGRC